MPFSYTPPPQSIHIATIYCRNKKPSPQIINTIRTPLSRATSIADMKTSDMTQLSKTEKLLIQYTEDHNYTTLNDNEPTYINDSTGKADVKDLIIASPRIMATFQDFWMDEELGSDHRTITATFSTHPLTYN